MFKLSQDEIAFAMDEITKHKELPVNHPDCEFCSWIKEFTTTTYGQVFAEKCTNSTEYLDKLYFLLIGIKIGRRQGVEDLIADLEDPEATRKMMLQEIDVDQKLDTDERLDQGDDFESGMEGHAE